MTALSYFDIVAMSPRQDQLKSLTRRFGDERKWGDRPVSVDEMIGAGIHPQIIIWAYLRPGVMTDRAVRMFATTMLDRVLPLKSLDHVLPKISGLRSVTAEMQAWLEGKTTIYALREWLKTIDALAAASNSVDPEDIEARGSYRDKHDVKDVAYLFSTFAHTIVFGSMNGAIAAARQISDYLLDISLNTIGMTALKELDFMQKALAHAVALDSVTQKPFHSAQATLFDPEPEYTIRAKIA